MAIHRLPNELIEQIVDNITPDMHFSFALSCKRHLCCSQSMLAHHRACSIKHKEITDVFDDFSRPADPVAAWHNREFVAYRPFKIVDALQIPTLRSLEIRKFHDRHGRGNFDPSKLPAGFRSSITELYLNHVETMDEAQLEVLICCFTDLKVLKVENCSFDTGNKLMELVAKLHFQTMEVIHYDKNQRLCADGTRLYNMKYLSHFTNLCHLVVNVSDILCDALRSTLHDAFCFAFPPSLKYLKIIWTWTARDMYWSNSRQESVSRGMDLLDNAITGVKREKAASGSFCLERLNLAVWNTSVLEPYDGQYVSWLFPNFDGHQVGAVDFARNITQPFFYRAIEAGHDAKIVVETFHHSKSMCKHCGTFP